MSYLKDVIDRFKRLTEARSQTDVRWSRETPDGTVFGFRPKESPAANDVRETRLAFPTRKVFTGDKPRASVVEYLFLGEPSSSVEAFAEELRSELNALLGRQSGNPLATVERIAGEIEHRRLAPKAFAFTGAHRYELLPNTDSAVSPRDIHATLSEALSRVAPVFIMYRAAYRDGDPFPARIRRVNVMKLNSKSFQGRTVEGVKTFTLSRVESAIMEGYGQHEVGYELKLTVELRPGKNANSVITVSKNGVPSLLEQQLSEKR